MHVDAHCHMGVCTRRPFVQQFTAAFRVNAFVPPRAFVTYTECYVVAFVWGSVQRQWSCRVPTQLSALLHHSVSWQQGVWGNQCKQTKTPPSAWQMLQSGEAGRLEMVSVQQHGGKKWVTRKSPYGRPPPTPHPTPLGTACTASSPAKTNPEPRARCTEGTNACLHLQPGALPRYSLRVLTIHMSRDCMGIERQAFLASVTVT